MKWSCSHFYYRPLKKTQQPQTLCTTGCIIPIFLSFLLASFHSQSMYKPEQTGEARVSESCLQGPMQVLHLQMKTVSSTFSFAVSSSSLRRAGVQDLFWSVRQRLRCSASASPGNAPFLLCDGFMQCILRAIWFCSWWCLGAIWSKTCCAAALVTETKPEETARSAAVVPFLNAVTARNGAGCWQICCSMWLGAAAVFSPVEFGLWLLGPRSSRES